MLVVIVGGIVAVLGPATLIVRWLSRRRPIGSPA